MSIETIEIRNYNGKGGSYSLEGSSSGFPDSYSTSVAITTLKHFHLKTGMNVFSTSTTWRVLFLDSVDNVVGQISSVNGGPLKAYRGATEIAASSFTPAPGSFWYLIEVEHFSDQISGFIKVWVDGILAMNFSGDTGLIYPNRWRFQGETRPRWDDIGVNSITLQYYGGSGMVPVAGEVITSAGGGSATITTVNGDLVSGTLTLHNWNGTPFINGEFVKVGAGLPNFLDAFVNAPTTAFVNGFEPDSGRLGNEFIQYIPPNSVGNSSQLGLAGTTGTQATQTLTTTSIPLDTETVTIGAKTYIFQPVLTDVDGNVAIGGSQAQAMENLRRAINLDGVVGVNYATSMTANTDITATDTATTVVATSLFNGTSQNSIGTTETLANGSWGSPTLLGGAGENYQGVDEIPPNSTDRVEANTVNLKDTYGANVDGILPFGINITYVAGVAVCKSGLVGVNNIQFVTRTGGADYNTQSIALGSSDTVRIGQFPTDPSDNTKWTRAKLIEPLFEFGLEMKA